MKHKSYLALYLSLLLGMGHLMSHPASVVVIGGGPAGLGAAIEAREAGADVILVEKRSAYTRQNTLFLYATTLELFERWHVTIPLMEKLVFRGEGRGFVLIKDLEEGLSHRVDALGVQRIVGEFIDFAKDSHTAIIQTEDGREFFPYDILVGADGVHSRVREKLRIDSLSLGESAGVIITIPTINPEKEIIAEIQPHREVFTKKVYVPSTTIVFMQNQPEVSLKQRNLHEMTQLVSEIGWEDEASSMIKGADFRMEDVPIYLKRSVTFSDQAKEVILLGDAAGTGSFYYGIGVNFSFKSTQLAKELFQHWPEKEAYERFNQAMEIEVDSLMKTNLPLFE